MFVFVLMLTILPTPGVSQPNIIMIMADDLGWNDVGYHGSEISTPNIDSLAAKGITLNNYYTAPNCGPSRAQFLTGKYLTRLGLQHANMQPCRPRGIPVTEPTVADELKDLGYNTHLIGKWHGGFHTTPLWPTHRGFDSFRGMLNGQGDHFTHDRGFRGQKVLDFYNDTTPYAGAAGIYSTDYYERRAHEVIDEHSQSGRPMFMFLSFQAPHQPNQAPQRYIDMYNNIADRGRQRYAAMVTAMDDAIGSVVQKLTTENMLENTVIVFSTDNGGQALSGGASNFPLRGNKGGYYEAGIRGVALVSSPMISSIGASNSLVHITDWMPTFLHLAGGSPSRSLDGVNQWQTLTNGAKSARKEIIYNIDPLDVSDAKTRRKAERRAREKRNRGKPVPYDVDQVAAIRFEDWKLITGRIGFDGVVPNPRTNIAGYRNAKSQKNKRKNKTSSVRLYNIRTDRTESKDLSSQRTDIVRMLTRKLQMHQLNSLPPFYPRMSDQCSPQIINGIQAWGPYL